MLERISDGSPSGPRAGGKDRERAARAGCSLSATSRIQTHTQRLRCSSPRLSGTPSLPLAHLHIPPNKLFCVHLSFFDKLKEQQKEGEKEKLSFSLLGRHKGSGVLSIGVALTWLNSSSGVSLVMSLIPKTSHAPFTASHTKLNAKSKTQTPGRRSVRKRGKKG